MRYYLDTEFDGFGGDLLSLALASEAGDRLYLLAPEPASLTQWVAENVWPIVLHSPVPPIQVPVDRWGAIIAFFLRGDDDPEIFADWPDDIRYFCQTVITGPGEMVSIPSLTFHVVRIDAYPTNLEGAVQHNAMWDALALRQALE